MHSWATVSSKATGQTVIWVRRTPFRPRALRRFRTFIESTDWERRYLCHWGIDRACLGVILLSALYFLPVLASAFLR
jgi:hypothetical protein